MIKKITLFLITLIAILFGLEWIYDYGLMNNVNVKSTYIVRKKINADIVSIGTSNVLFTIVPDTFEKTSGYTIYNLATNHSSLAENLAHLHLYLSNNIKPKLVLVGISPADMSLSDWTFHSYYFSPYVKDTFINSLIKHYDTKFYYLSKAPFLKYAFYNQFVNPLVFKGYIHRYKRDTLAYWPKGSYFYPLDTMGFVHFNDSVKSHHGIINYKWSREYDYQLKFLLSYLNKMNISVMLYEPPVWQGSHQYFSGRNTLIKHIDSIAHQYNSVYLTFDTLELCKQRKNFATVFHTYPAPSADFTKILVKSLQNLSYNKGTAGN